mmetsp:Transcript_17516/g.43058  ORF Transcript_17516/g.43058 Transcript_17516/m.43058 type:complete len:138 (-) Transcript_17516:60-473(-)|eukprot:CAMPEP_0113635432 /NCGR_PEP_ID=MMETSP0017_2-20120614/18471_1 /TAXON_ID=2856 /ORGANISM="Cylindrotheca closterium" /LENGTH=137 /DNA_ID=CAMNT_0000546215 /DNA_START=201 /DNA_END=614 /DNA_ORIENTATION=- /assembly_acc=CAM_ASM_000147
MKINVPLSSLLFVILMEMTTMQSDALLMRNHYSTPKSPTTVLSNAFEQLPGESDIDFIERVTSNSKAFMEESASAQSEEEEPKEKKPKGKYQRIEEWDEERKAKGEMSWEEKVRFDGQRHGNQVRQNDILLRNLHSF